MADTIYSVLRKKDIAKRRGICTSVSVIKCAGGDIVEMTEKERSRIEEMLVDLVLALLYEKGIISTPVEDCGIWTDK